MKNITAIVDYQKQLRMQAMQVLQDQPHLLLRNIYVGFRGPAAPVYTVVGEAPGEMEEVEGRPFAGAAGKLLEHLLQEVGIVLDTVAFTNVMKVRPAKHRQDLVGAMQGNRTPTPEEAEAFRPLLVAELEMLQPRVIIAAGAVAGSWFVADGLPYSITRRHGIVTSYQTQAGFVIPVIPVYHPSYLLHRRQEYRGREREHMIEDLRFAHDLACKA